MNLSELIGRIGDELNESDCGVCWKPIFGGRQDYLNLANRVIDVDECCAILGILNTTFEDKIRITDTGVEKTHREWVLKAFAGIPSGLDLQFYDEVDPDQKDSSKWSRFLHPIQCCLGSIPDLMCYLNNCDGESTIELIRFKASLKLNYLDNNYDGWMLDLVFKEF